LSRVEINGFAALDNRPVFRYNAIKRSVIRPLENKIFALFYTAPAEFTQNSGLRQLGIAEGRSKPTVIILCEEIKTSFIGSGLVSNNDDRLVLKCKTISEIPKLFTEEVFLKFVQKAIIR